MNEPLSVRATIVLSFASMAALWLCGVLVEQSTQYGSMIP